jgi:thiol-disulfide isomerase/thioredoxin
MKKYVFFFFISFLIFGSFGLADAQEEPTVYFFYSKTCPHCAEEKAFLENLAKKEYRDITIKEFLVSENFELLEKYYLDYRVPERVYGWVPITFIGDDYFLGFNQEIAGKIEECLEKEEDWPCGCQEESENPLEEISTPFEMDEQVNLPFLGKINPGDYSLPALAVILGFFDGFNVCSLGALVLILSLVLALRERKRIFLFGGIFIITTAAVYGLLILLWYKIFSFFASYFRIMEIFIGILGVGGGIYFLRQFVRYKKYGPTCQTEAGKGIVNRISEKIKGLLQERKSFFLAVFGIFLFALVVTVVEFPCSAAIPVLFAGILAKTQIDSFSYLFYIALFVLFYMLDEFAVFLLAALTMSIKIISPKVLVYITLLASLVLFFLGFHYLFGF